MHSDTVTEEFATSGHVSPSDQAPTEVHERPPIPAVSSARERCASCAAALAPDQRYCVDCGQRRGGSAPPFSGHLAALPSAQPTAAPAHARRPLLSINATLIAGIGTLLLAMGIGVLIGRAGQSAGKAPPVQLLAAPGVAPSAAAGATTGAAGSEAVPGVSTSTTGAAAAKAGGSGATSKPIPKKSRPPAPKVVKVGAKGSGPGYQKGKFTGNFFGEEEK